MEVFEEEMKFEKDNAKKLKTVSADTLSPIELFKNDEKLQQDLRALQASTSEPVLGHVGDEIEDTTDLLSQASAKQQELNTGKDGDKSKNPAQGKDEETKGSGK